MRSTAIVVCSFLMLSAVVLLVSQGPPPAPLPLPGQTISLPTFTSTATVAGTNYTYTLLGGDPAKGGTTTIPTVLAPITLTIDAPMDADGRKAVLDAGPIARQESATPLCRPDVGRRCAAGVAQCRTERAHRSQSSVACDRLD
jgi:hypothetical protein